MVLPQVACKCRPAAKPGYGYRSVCRRAAAAGRQAGRRTFLIRFWMVSDHQRQIKGRMAHTKDVYGKGGLLLHGQT